MANVTMILVGGFLGAGKTTLLARAAERLSARGLRVGLITNDQAANLVDTEVLREAGQDVKEVAGACFCCAFNKLLYACDNLINLHHPDVIIGEPVGSCTDLSATVLQPLKKYCSDRFTLAPYSVLVDPDKLRESLESGETSDIPQAVLYIYRKQLQEADLIVLNKSDRLSDRERADVLNVLAKEYGGIPVLTMSALTCQGVDEWLDKMLGGGESGARIVEVDYDTYADGEAALGWLNAAMDMDALAPTDWKRFAADFMARCQVEIKKISGDIAHLKILLSAEGGQLQANLTGNAGQALVQGDELSPSRHATLVVNARVRTSPEELKTVVERCLLGAAGVDIRVNVAEMASFRPGRPNPVHRFDAVVDP